MAKIDLDRPSNIASGSRAGLAAQRVSSVTRVAAFRILSHRMGQLSCVFVGGALGTAAREAISLAYPAADGVPYAIGLINIGGAMLLGLVTGLLTGRDRHRHQGARLLFGTGLCGGFTTYSTFATQVAELAGRGSAGIGIGYGLVTAILGVVAAWIGLLIGGANLVRPAAARATR